MLRDKTYLVLLALVCCFCTAWLRPQSADGGSYVERASRPTGGLSTGSPLINGQDSRATAAISTPGRDTASSLAETMEMLSYPSVAQRFYEIACELADSGSTTGRRAEQAIVFLMAAQSLDTDGRQLSTDDRRPLLIRLACRHPDRNYSKMVYRWLMDYIDEDADPAVVKEAVGYLLDQVNTREQREALLSEMIRQLNPGSASQAKARNNVVTSELTTRLGLLKAEQGDLEAAQVCFLQAYTRNKYNKLAFAKLAELVPDRVNPVAYLEHLRLVLRENPLDIDAALAYAQYAEQLQVYPLAAGTYEYCAMLFGYLYPNQPLSGRIYMPWTRCSYNSPPDRYRCLEIANLVRKSGGFDVLIEAFAARAAEKTGDTAQSGRIFQAVEQRVNSLLNTQNPAGSSLPASNKEYEQSAWFYCFGRQDAIKALGLANRAYSIDPNSPSAASILAYALVMNQQLEWAKPLVESSNHTQIGLLTLGLIQLAEGKKSSAIQALQAAVAKDPASLAAEKAKEILIQQGAEYVPPLESNSIMTALAKSFNSSKGGIIPVFISPEKMISVQFSIRGNEFSYGSEIPAGVAIVNNSREPLVISDESILQGNIRIDAHVTGDLTGDIPNLISHRISSSMLIEPGQSISVSMQLARGELAQMLLGYPQASLEIEFTIYLDPVSIGQGKISNRLADIKPVTVSVKRPGIDLTGQYLRTRFNSLSTGQPSQKIKTAQLFVGLLKEQNAMAEHGSLYRLKYADWMPGLLRSALLNESGLLRSGGRNEWAVKVHTMADMLSLPLDYELIGAVAESLQNAEWPVRMMAIYLLANQAAPGSAPASNSGGGFANVLDWAAENDSSSLVRSMAIALRAAG